MAFTQIASVLAMVIGAAILLVGFFNRHRGGWAALPIGLALLIGPLSPLTEEALPEFVRMCFSVAAVVLAAVGIVVAVTTRPIPRVR